MSKSNVRVEVVLTRVQADLLGMLATGGALASEKSRTEQTMWSRIAFAVGAGVKEADREDANIAARTKP